MVPSDSSANHPQAPASPLRKLVSCRMWLAVVVFGFGVLLLLWAASPDQNVLRMARCYDNVHNITLACSRYSTLFGHLPPAYTVDRDGRHMHSWRVLILPFLQEKELYDRFKLEEPWNSPHNLAVSESIPEVYHCLSDDANLLDTSYVMVLGHDALSDGPTARRPEEIKDSPTIIVVEVTNSGIHWSEPRDLNADEIDFRVNSPNAPGIGSRHRPRGAYVGYCNGHFDFLPDSVDPRAVRALTTIAGQERLLEDEGGPVTPTTWHLAPTPDTNSQ